MSRVLSLPARAGFMVLLIAGVAARTSVAGDSAGRLRFRFDGQAADGWTNVARDTEFSTQTGFGFETPTSSGPARFSVVLPEGNYRVTASIGRPDGESTTTIKAELRRLMVESVHTNPGQTVTRSFVVNIRTPAIAGGGHVSLKPRERELEWIAWDDKLTLEFCGEHPAVSAIEIQKVDVPTIYLLGDSTVCDQPGEPWASWGQMLPRWFNDQIAIANHAESGEALKSSLGAHRLDKILSLARPGDWLFIQFGHNDMKARGEGVGAFTTYKSDLTHFVTEARARQINVVLVTSCERKAGVKADTLGDYPEAVRQTAGQQNVPLVDLHQLSKQFYKALGPNLDKAFQDGTHHNNYGAYELSKIIVQQIKAQKLELAEYVVDDFAGFDASRPDPVDSVQIAPSRGTSTTAPLGN